MGNHIDVAEASDLHQQLSELDFGQIKSEMNYCGGEACRSQLRNKF